MKSAYNSTWVYNLAVIKEVKRWCKHAFIEKTQLAAISEAYKSPLYHPNFTICILLFVATLLALSGVTGLFVLFFADAGEKGISTAATIYGTVSFFVLELSFTKNNHYKSGVTEALLYHACGFIIGGFAGLNDFNPLPVLLACLIVFTFSAIRYLDLICTLAGVISFASILFYEFYNFGGVFQKIIPFVFIISFTPIYFFAKKLKGQSKLKLWSNNLLIVESLSLLLIYLGGNYLVVRELSISMMGLEIEEGKDIPFAFIFYTTTVIIPIVYLYTGVKNKDNVLLRISLIVLAFSVFTFKYYYSLGHAEITLTIAGAILLIVSIVLFNYLKTMRRGFSRDNLLSEKWGNINVEAFIISQTMGGNQVSVDDKFKGEGGEFGGGGASGSF